MEEFPKALENRIPSTGQIQQQKNVNELLRRDLRHRIYEPACFPAGTLVHTREGLKPIEQIQVGDWVLSKHESGQGEREYKRVTQTFVHEDRQVILIHFGGLKADGSKRWHQLAVTPEHPLWVQGKGWKQAASLRATWPKRTQLELVSDDRPEVGDNVRLFVTDMPGIAWVPSNSLGDAVKGLGSHLDVQTQIYTKRSVYLDIPYVENTKRAKPEHLFRTTVYNLEVEDFHTYYVGEAGVWVHNKNVQ